MWKTLKNDKERIAFLEDYRNLDHGWYLWMDIGAIDRRLWRFDLPDRSLVVEETLQTFEWPKRHEEWRVKEWFIVSDWEQPFSDHNASRTLALQELKRCGKEFR